MADLTQPGTPIDVEKMRSLQVLGVRQYAPRVEEGRHHPETGLPYKAVTDEHNHTVTEHSGGTGASAGVSVRQDVHLRPKAVRVAATPKEGA